MNSLAGCTITPDHIAHWARLLVTDMAPYFLPGELVPVLASDIPVFPRDSGLQHHLALPFQDSYTTYRVEAECQHVAFLTDDALRSMHPPTRRDVLHAQWRYGRNQVYAWEQVAAFFAGDAPPDHIHDFVIDTPAGRQLVLGSTLWQALPAEQQERWLYAFVADKLHPYPTIARERVVFPPNRAAQLASLANRFALTSGANCFATTLAAITETASFAQAISRLWLHQPPFLEGLAARGYRQDRTVDARDGDLHDAVVVWSDDAGLPQHACWLLGQGIVLNKNAQSWFMPRHLATIGDVLAYWEEDELAVQVYTRRM